MRVVTTIRRIDQNHSTKLGNAFCTRKGCAGVVSNVRLTLKNVNTPDQSGITRPIISFGG
jgi:hypothetical protein